MAMETDDEGNITVHPIGGWEYGTAFGTACVFQLQYAESPEELTSLDPSALRKFQIVLTPQQCRALARDLLRAAERVEQSRPAATPS